ncbi:hypothetical protein DFS34DRAFT_243338 [Phlyctochytrium arcticum]|nr:hypothetical protein DFS34DRAFT_243338 [Phlyctochytrium arcticum]
MVAVHHLLNPSSPTPSPASIIPSTPPPNVTGTRYMCPVKSCRLVFGVREELAQHSRARHNRTYEAVLLGPSEEAPQPQIHSQRNHHASISTTPSGSSKRKASDASSPDSAPTPYTSRSRTNSLEDRPAAVLTPTTPPSVIALPADTPNISRSKKRKVDASPSAKRSKGKGAVALHATTPGSPKKKASTSPTDNKPRGPIACLRTDIRLFTAKSTLMQKYAFCMAKYQRDIVQISQKFKASALMEPNPNYILTPFNRRIKSLAKEGSALQDRIAAVQETLDTNVLAGLKTKLTQEQGRAKIAGAENPAAASAAEVTSSVGEVAKSMAGGSARNGRPKRTAAAAASAANSRMSPY